MFNSIAFCLMFTNVFDVSISALETHRLMENETVESLIVNESLANVNELSSTESTSLSDHDTEANTQDSSEIIETIYLNGSSGDDNNAGNDENLPVKTFERAKELASSNSNIKNIIITGEVELNGDISLKGTNAKILRSKNYNSYLFRVLSPSCKFLVFYNKSFILGFYKLFIPSTIT